MYIPFFLTPFPAESLCRFSRERISYCSSSMSWNQRQSSQRRQTVYSEVVAMEVRDRVEVFSRYMGDMRRP